MMLLNYAYNSTDATICYHVSDILLYAHSDASYLSEPKASFREGAYLLLSDKQSDPSKPLSTPTPLNGLIFFISKILRKIMSSAGEAEIVAYFLTATEAVPIRTTLHELGQPKPATHIQVDGTTCNGFANKTIKQKQTKLIDMRFYCL